jgi:uncharacterized BrkB/YihY/UPF0761 family membrane protein
MIKMVRYIDYGDIESFNGVMSGIGEQNQIGGGYKKPVIGFVLLLFIVFVLSMTFLIPIASQIREVTDTSGSLYEASVWGALLLKIVPMFIVLVSIFMCIGYFFSRRSEESDYDMYGYYR